MAPEARATADRLPLVDTGIPRKNPAAMFSTDRARSSSGRQQRRIGGSVKRSSRQGRIGVGDQQDAHCTDDQLGDEVGRDHRDRRGRQAGRDFPEQQDWLVDRIEHSGDDDAQTRPSRDRTPCSGSG